MSSRVRYLLVTGGLLCLGFSLRIVTTAVFQQAEVRGEDGARAPLSSLFPRGESVVIPAPLSPVLPGMDADTGYGLQSIPALEGIDVLAISDAVLRAPSSVTKEQLAELLNSLRDAPNGEHALELLCYVFAEADPKKFLKAISEVSRNESALEFGAIQIARSSPEMALALAKEYKNKGLSTFHRELSIQVVLQSLESNPEFALEAFKDSQFTVRNSIADSVYFHLAERSIAKALEEFSSEESKELRHLASQGISTFLSRLSPSEGWASISLLAKELPPDALLGSVENWVNQDAEFFSTALRSDSVPLELKPLVAGALTEKGLEDGNVELAVDFLKASLAREDAVVSRAVMEKLGGHLSIEDAETVNDYLLSDGGRIDLGVTGFLGRSLEENHHQLLQWVDEIAEAEIKSQLVSEISRLWPDEMLEVGFDALPRLSLSDLQKSRVGAEILGRLIEVDQSRARTLLLDELGGVLPETTAQSSFYEWAKSDGTFASEVWENGSYGSESFLQLTSGWSSKYPPKAIEWIERMRQEGTELPVDEALVTVFRNWSTFDAVEASRWLAGNQYPESLHDVLAVALVEQIRKTAPIEAARWAKTIGDASDRRAVFERILDEASAEQIEAIIPLVEEGGL